MIYLFKYVWRLGKLRLTALVLLLLLAAFIELFLIASIEPLVQALEGAGVSQFQIFLFTSDEYGFVGAASIFTFLVVASTLIRFLALRSVNKFCHDVVAHIMSTSFNSMVYLGADRSARSVTYFTTVMERINYNFLQPALQLIYSTCFLLLILSLLLVKNFSLTFFALSFISVFYLIIILLNRNIMRHRSALQSDLQKKITSLVLERIQLWREILNFNLKDKGNLEFSTDAYLLSRTRSSIMTIGNSPKIFLEGLVLSAIGVYFLTASFLFFDNSVNLGALAIFAFSGQKMLPHIQQVYASIVFIKSVRSDLEVVIENLRLSSGTPDPFLSGGNLAGFAGLRFEDIQAVHKMPTDDRKQFHLAFNLDIRLGSKILISGTSGSGKSTIIDIICSFKRPTSGAIIAVNEESEVNVNDTTMYTAYVSQHPKMFIGDVKYNICLSNHPDQSELERLFVLCDSLGISDLLERSHMFGPNDGSLSGGQLQRIAVARALFSQKKILVFDEPTSGLDPLAKSTFWDLIDRLPHDVSAVVVSHETDIRSHFSNCYKIKGGRLECDD